MKVDAMLGAKGRKVITMAPETRISTIVHRLQQERVGAILLCVDGKTINGIISERDIVYGLVKYGVELMDRPASELMTKDVVTCAPDDKITEVMATMTQRRVRHIPVTENGELCGIVSIGDVVKNRLDEMEMETRVLRDYVTARR